MEEPLLPSLFDRLNEEALMLLVCLLTGLEMSKAQLEAPLAMCKQGINRLEFRLQLRG